MNRHFMRRLSLAVILISAVPGGSVAAQESFRVELGRDGETLGDMRPVFLKFESRPLPAISPKEVARRYQKLFEKSDEPEVRIDALNRLNNIRDRSGQDIGFSDEQQSAVYEEALASYESILARGSFSGKLDELLYQMAKAHALTGQHEESIQRLRQLVGLYPRSSLVPEARFRIAEAAYNAGEYQKAETGYRQLIEGDGHQDLAMKARYMLGWSQFKQGPAAWNRSAETFMALLDQHLPSEATLLDPPQSGLDMIEDSFRVLALMAARSDNSETLAAWLGNREPVAWPHLLYDRLADLHALEGRFDLAVGINQAFAGNYPEHSVSPDFLAQSVDYWRMAGDTVKAREARADYVARYQSQPKFQELKGQQQALWRDYARFLGDYHYTAQDWTLAAGYYEVLAGHSGDTGKLLHLAGDARLQAGNRDKALENYRSAAYGAGEQHYPDAAEAGWAAIKVLRSTLEESAAGAARGVLAELSSEEQQFGKTFTQDTRLSGLRADLANRWYEVGAYDEALAYARSTLVLESAKTEERYATWLVTARVRQRTGEFGLEERAWRQALLLVDKAPDLATTPDEPEQIREQLATAIYRQGERAAASGDTAVAVAHFQRVNSVVPNTEIAIRARFDASNALLKASEWQTAINELNRFRLDYPAHELTEEVSEKLVYAYHESRQPLKAAGELMVASKRAQDPWPLKLRAAALYHQAGELSERNALYVDWLAVAPDPDTAADHVQQQTMRQRLIESGVDAARQQKALVTREAASQWHSEETLLWAGKAALALGASVAQEFAAIRLEHPLERALERKQKAMEQAQAYFLEAESFAGETVASEVLYRRAELYRTLAADLMASEVPAELNELEAMQYQMLLEEEAWPLEERAMELHSRNHGRIASQGFDEWIGQSLEALAVMHPGRYDRELRWMSWNMEENEGA
jgi:cellulose synthase operon protein C